MAEKSELSEFQKEARAWIQENCPSSLLGGSTVYHGGFREPVAADVRTWFERCYARGWTVPGWPWEYGGAALSAAQQEILQTEMALWGAPAPLNGMGVSMIGPALLEFGSPEQKARHLPEIAAGRVRWCQGFSEPGAGSDLASLRTQADDHGDHFLVNGTKIWTSYGLVSDWMFCLVRTDTASKHEGISLLMFPMDSAGVETKPIVLISGQSTFCQCFFDNVRVSRSEMLGEKNKGWAIGKRILEFERSSVSRPGSQINSGPGTGAGGDGRSLAAIARAYFNSPNGHIEDGALRREIAAVDMKTMALSLTQARLDAEDPGFERRPILTSIFKYLSTELTSRRMEALVNIMGQRGLGWNESSFTQEELSNTRYWLYSKSFTIAGGCSEVQLDLISKRGLGME